MLGLIGLWSLPARSQEQPRVVNILIDDVGFTQDEFSALQQGIDDIIGDFGELQVEGYEGLFQSLPRSAQRNLVRCETDGICYEEVLRPEGIDFVLVTQVDWATEDYRAVFTAINLHGGTELVVTEGNFPDPNEPLYLLVPIYEALEPMAAADIDDGGRDDRDDRDDRYANRDDRDDRDADRDDRDDSDVAGPADDDIVLGTTEEPSNTLATALEAGGGTTMALGLVFWMLADKKQEEIQSRPHSRAEVLDLQSSGESLATLGNVAFFTGAAVLVAGIIFDIAGIGESSSGGLGDDFDDDEWLRVGVNPLAPLSPAPSAPSMVLEVDF